MTTTVNIVCLLLFTTREATHLNDYKMFDEEIESIWILQRNVDRLTEKLDQLESFKDALFEDTMSNVREEEFISNPLAIYKTITNLVVKLEDVKENIIEDMREGFETKKILKEDTQVSDEDRLYKVVREMINSQHLFNLTFADMMNGRVAHQNVTVEPHLEADDCFHVGKILNEKNDHEAAVNWLQKCESKLDERMRYPAFETLLLSSLFIGDKQLTLKAAEICKSNSKKYRVLHDLRIKLSHELGSKQFEDDEWESFNTCAGDYDNEISYRNLRCMYNHNNSPYLTIAPLKQEILSTVPKIFMFREAIYDSEIELLKSTSYHKLQQAGVQLPDGKLIVKLYNRNHQWVYLNPIELFRSLYRRLEDISSASLDKDTHSFKILHYTPGTFFRVHSDCLIPSSQFVLQYGNRAATALAYLNDVTLGGNTVFPRMKLNVKPSKGSVLYWLNVRIDGSKEEFTEHSSCPVIYGEKIVLSQGIQCVPL